MQRTARLGDIGTDIIQTADSLGLVPKAIISLPAFPWAGTWVVDPAAQGTWSTWLLPRVNVRIGQPTSDEIQGPNLLSTLTVAAVVIGGLAAYGGYRLVKG